ncbi:hypothetical protein AX16_002818 [Volvariella volvacea WC 439]|nr:hypothetical protein AX16_002818 [Volvariella volvacea WC 439]
MFSVQKPQGLTPEQVSKLSQAISAEVQRARGSEMAFQIATYCQEWIANHVVLPADTPASLAVQKNQRANDEAKARQQRAQEEALREAELARQREQELDEKIRNEDAMRQQLVKQQQQYQRRRANSEATEVPTNWDTLTETFPNEIEYEKGVRFHTVKIFYPRQEGLGTLYMAEPVFDDVNTTLPLELYVVTFDSHYYTTSQGKKKIKQVEAEIQRLTTIRHVNLVRILAVKLHMPQSSGAPQLMVLSEQPPPLTLCAMLEDCDYLREDRATVYLKQILFALNALHAGDLVHRGITAKCIGLEPDPTTQYPSKRIKLGRLCFHTRLLDLHRSNPFGGNVPQYVADESIVPDAWLSKDVKNDSSLTYTRHRDIHSVGIVLMQMLLGLYVTQNYSDIHSALQALQAASISAPLQKHAANMLLQTNKKNLSCLTLLADLAEASATQRIQNHSQSFGHSQGQGQGFSFNYGPSYFAPYPTPPGNYSQSTIGSNNGFAGGFRVGSPGSYDAGAVMAAGMAGQTGTGAGIGIPGSQTPHAPYTPGQNGYGNKTPPIPYQKPNSPIPGFVSQSPEVEYFRMPPRPRQSSRWKEDWEELELLGKGAFGSVVKARNKIDSRIYAVKKIKLRAFQADTRIFREVNALSRLSHRNIVRYYTTWLETSEPMSTVVSDESGTDEGTMSIPGYGGIGGVRVRGHDFSGIAITVSEDSSSVGSGLVGSLRRKGRKRGKGSDDTEGPASDGDEDNDEDTEEDDDVDTTTTSTSERHLPGNSQISFGLDDLSALDDENSLESRSRSSFPSIHFSSSVGGSSSGMGGGSSEDDEDGAGTGPFDSLFTTTSAGSKGAIGSGTGGGSVAGALTIPGAKGRSGHGLSEGRDMLGRLTMPQPMVSRTLYIQMEFVERQTLKERVDEGISEEEAWRLFHQIVDALVHMSTLGILHRDIKPTNIFIDAKGDCKVGDFGLATSSLAAVDPSDKSPAVTASEELTLEVGTRLYIAPEVQSRKRGPRNHSKADLYSLGVVFFEMNYSFRTASERIAVIEMLRKPNIFFPDDWDITRDRQKKIITWLLQHEPDDRPTAIELSQSPLLPPRLEDEYFKGALRMMAKPDSPHHQAVLSALFTQTPRISRNFLYDADPEGPENTLNGVVIEQLAGIFRLHGALDMEPPLLMPVMDPDDEKTHATMIDKQGDIVTLPNSLLPPFARLAARRTQRRIKRYHITNIYLPNPIPGHPKVHKAAIFDIITPDLISGPSASGAELISVANDCLDRFPNLSHLYDIHVSHSGIVELIMNRLPATQRQPLIDLVNPSKAMIVQRRAGMLKKGVLRSVLDDLEVLAEPEDDFDSVLHKLERQSSTLVPALEPLVEELKQAVQYAQLAGVKRQIFFHPLMLGSHHSHFKHGLLIEVVKKHKRTDVLAAGGRYDTLISRYYPPKTVHEPLCAMGLQISVEKITATLAVYQGTSVKALVKEERSFGYWSPRRCDVYVVSHHPGYLQDRLEIVSQLWKHNISADLMYESGLADFESENYMDLCTREGILFLVWPRPRTGRARDQPALKVKNILKGNEHELSRQELVGWLQHQIAEQKRIDIATSGAPAFTEYSQHQAPSKELPPSSDVQLLLPVDLKKQRKHVKQIFLDRAYEKAVEIKSAMNHGVQFLAIDVPATVLEHMTRSSHWITDDDAWKPIFSFFPPGNSAYAQQLREGIARKKSEGVSWILLFSVREDRVQLLSLGDSSRP